MPILHPDELIGMTCEVGVHHDEEDEPQYWAKCTIKSYHIDVEDKWPYTANLVVSLDPDDDQSVEDDDLDRLAFGVPIDEVCYIERRETVK